MNSKIKVLTGSIAMTAILALFSTTASADPWHRHHRYHQYHPHHFHHDHHHRHHHHHHGYYR